MRRFAGLVTEGAGGVLVPWIRGWWVLGLKACRAMRQ